MHLFVDDKLASAPRACTKKLRLSKRIEIITNQSPLHHSAGDANAIACEMVLGNVIRKS